MTTRCQPAATGPADTLPRMGIGHGWVIEWFEKDGDEFVAREELRDVEVGWLQELFAEPSVDDMMCMMYAVAPDQLEKLKEHVSVDLNAQRLDYFVAGWADPGFQTPGGLYPPRRDPPPFIPGGRPLRPF